jgi:hypothetical protein
MENILVLTRNINKVVTCLIADSIDETAAIARQAARADYYYAVAVKNGFPCLELSSRCSLTKALTAIVP